jgi:hypothetical protein
MNLICMDYLGKKRSGREDCADLYSTIAYPSTHRHPSRNATCGLLLPRHKGALTSRNGRGRFTLGPPAAPDGLAGGDAVQAGEVIHAEAASRVLDHSLAPHLDQLGATHGACRTDEFRQFLMAQADIDGVAVSAALAFEADQVPERGGHPCPDRCGELSEQPTLEKLRARRHRFEKHGGKFGLGLRRGLHLRALHFEYLRGAVGDGLLVLGRDESAKRLLPERPIAEETAPSQDQPDEVIAVETLVNQLDVT